MENSQHNKHFFPEIEVPTPKTAQRNENPSLTSIPLSGDGTVTLANSANQNQCILDKCSKKIQKKTALGGPLAAFSDSTPKGGRSGDNSKNPVSPPRWGGGDAPQAMGWYVLFSAKILGLQPPNLSKHHFDHLFKRFLVRPCWAELPALFQQAPGVFLFFF